MEKVSRVIIFDFDGVIIDSWQLAYERNLRDWPDLKPEEHKSFFNTNIYEELAKMPPSLQTKEERKKYLNTEYFPAKNKLPIFPKIREVLEKLSISSKLVINTSASRETTISYLKNNNLYKYFSGVYGKETSIDKVANFELISKHFDIPLKECIFITDTVGDVLVAEKLEIPTILVSWGYQNKDYFEPVARKVISIVDEPIELIKAIDLI